MARRKKEAIVEQEVAEAVKPVKAPPVVTKYQNLLAGTLKIDKVIFPGKGSLVLTDEQANSKRMLHAIACEVINVIND